MENLSFKHRLGFAVDGIRHVWRSERSFRTQSAYALGAGLLTVVLWPGWYWAAAMALVCVLVLALELMNSSLEYLIDHIHPEIAPAIKHAKDAAAGSVLLASLGALVVGACMLISVLG